jgi:hypothetical protein
MTLDDLLAAPEEDPLMDAIIEMAEAAEECWGETQRTVRRRRPYQRDLPVAPSWKQYRSDRSDLMFFRFLGVTTKVFDALCHHMRPLLPSYDKSVRRPGGVTDFDHIDVAAVCLRRLQLVGDKWMDTMEESFGRTATPIRRALVAGRTALLYALRRMPAAAIRHPTLEEATEAWEGFKKVHGLPPWYGRGWAECEDWALHPPPVEGCDGTDTPAQRSGRDKEASEQNGNKGVKWIHLLATCINGTIVDYAACVVGSFNDSRISRRTLKRFRSSTKNSARVSMALDNGWKTRICYPLPNEAAHLRSYTPGEPMLMRPMIDSDRDKVPHDYKNYFSKASAYITVFRQHGEWTNGGLKVQFPFIMQPQPPRRVDSLKMDFETVRVAAQTCSIFRRHTLISPLTLSCTAGGAPVQLALSHNWLEPDQDHLPSRVQGELSRDPQKCQDHGPVPQGCGRGGKRLGPRLLRGILCFTQENSSCSSSPRAAISRRIFLAALRASLCAACSAVA